MTTLSLSEVRAIAHDQGLQEIYYNEDSRVVSFAAAGAQEHARINVYWTTGTVGTCIEHPRQGKTQLFRRNVDLTALRTIFRDPRVHTGRGYYRSDGSAGVGSSRKRLRSVLDEGMRRGGQPWADANDEETEANTQMERLRAEQHAIENDMRQVQAVIDTFAEKRRLEAAAQEKKRQIQAEKKRHIPAEKKRQIQAEKTRQTQAELDRRTRLVSLDRARMERGTQMTYNIHYSRQVSEMWRKTVTCVAMGETATLMLYEDGTSSWTCSLPKLLRKILNVRRKSLQDLDYVAMGSQDRFYVRFPDGKAEWVGSDSMTKAIRKRTCRIKTVAFGETWESYFIVFEDGGFSYRDVPTRLNNIIEMIKSRQQECKLTCVSLGPDGEYFLKTRNDKILWGGMTTSAMAATRKLKDRIKFLQFGGNDSYFCRYASDAVNSYQHEKRYCRYVMGALYQSNALDNALDNASESE